VTVCSWCGSDSEESAKRFEGPHATWCVHFRESQRGGPKAARSEPPHKEDLLGLLRECAKCSCGFACYCDSNAEWAERELEKLGRAK